MRMIKGFKKRIGIKGAAAAICVLICAAAVFTGTFESNANNDTDWKGSVRATELRSTEITREEQIGKVKYPLIAAIPQEDIYLYGRGGHSQGVILKYKNHVQCFDWNYITPRLILPQLSFHDFDGDGKKELACDLYISSGTGVGKEELHILELTKKGLWKDYKYNEEIYLTQIEEQVGTINGEKSGQILLTIDGRKEIATMRDRRVQLGNFKGLAYGDIIGFDLSKGAKITMDLAVGGFYENAVVPEYFGYIKAKVQYQNGGFRMYDLKFFQEDK